MPKKPTRITEPLTTTKLIDVVAADLDVPTPQAHEIVMAVFSAIARANAAGHQVAITNFGTFISYRTKRRTARNPQTNEPVIVQAHQALRFRPSPRLVDMVRRRDRNASIRKLPKGSLTKTDE